MVKEKEEILETEEPVEEKIEKKQEVKTDNKKTKKSKKDVAEDLDEILYGGKETKYNNIDMGEVPDFMSLKPTGKKTKENIPDYLRY